MNNSQLLGKSVIKFTIAFLQTIMYFNIRKSKHVVLLCNGVCCVLLCNGACCVLLCNGACCVLLCNGACCQYKLLKKCRRPVQRPLIKMANNSVSACIEQRVVMKFLVNKGVKPADIYRRLQAQYDDETLSRSKTFEWCKHFKDASVSISDDPGHGGSKPKAVIPVNIQCVECLILDNRHITCREIAQEMNLSVGVVNTIIHEHLHFRKVSARWVPRQLSTFDWHRRVEGCTELKEHFDGEGQDFLDCIITCDKTWVHHFTPKSK